MAEGGPLAEKSSPPPYEETISSEQENDNIYPRMPEDVSAEPKESTKNDESLTDDEQQVDDRKSTDSGECSESLHDEDGNSENAKLLDSAANDEASLPDEVVNLQGLQLTQIGNNAEPLPKERSIGDALCDTALIMKAADFAARRHRYQRRKDLARTPYINHPIGVAYILTNEAKIYDTATIIAAILHDIVEDTKTTADEVREMFGDEVCAIVMECTIDKSQPRHIRKRTQIENASKLSHKAKLVELANNLYNMRDIERAKSICCSCCYKKECFELARDYVTLMKGTNEMLEAALDDIINKNLK